MVDGAMQALEDDEWNCLNSSAHARRTALAGARYRGEECRARMKAEKAAATGGEECGSVLIFISIALKLFEWFILPKILEWWRNR